MPDVTEMEWRQCVGYPDHEISECGDLRRKPDAAKLRQSGRRLRGFIDIDGYICYMVNTSEGARRIKAHVAVTMAFIGLPPDDDQRWEVAHNNGSRLLNTPANLRWATRKENSDDRVIHRTSCQGVNNGRAKISEDDVHYIRRRYREIKHKRDARVGELDEKFGLNRGQIIAIAKGHSWSHVEWKGYD